MLSTLPKDNRVHKESVMSHILPNFLVLGAAKSGTTSLYRYLKQHPQIFLSDKKETNFFACEGIPPNSFRGDGRMSNFLSSSITKLEDYQALFQQGREKIASGEVSTTYLYDKGAPARIQRLIPGAKLIAILRNPIERAYSHYLHLRRAQREPFSNFIDALQAEQVRIQEHYVWSYFYKDQGFYFQQLQRYYALFPAEQVRVYLYEDLKNDAHKLVTDLFSFIGVDKDFPVDTNIKYNTGGIPIHPWFGRIISTNNGIRTLIKQLFKPKTRQQLRKLYVRLFIRPAPLMPGFAYELLRDAYHEDITNLQDLLQRDLSAWLAPAKT
jgi:hypothetical protein